MGADYIAIHAEIDPNLSYNEIHRRVCALSEREIREAVDWAFGAELEDMALDGDTPQAFALRMLGEVFDPKDDGATWRYIGWFEAHGNRWLTTGNLSWGDVPDGYDGLAFLDATGVLKPELWDVDSIQFPRLLAEIAATQDLDYAALTDSMDLDDEEINQLLDRAQDRWENIKREDFT